MGVTPDSEVWQSGPEAIWRWWTDVRPGRDELPWRHERDPWLVLVAETMLAQTQAARVAERYPAVVAQLSSPTVTASRSVGEMVGLWSGLGYYRRARSLRDCAIALVERHGGVVPNDLGALLALPGVGAYTARAVLAFAFGERVGVLDTNIGRVLARAVAGRPLGVGEAQSLADALVPLEQSRAWNLALMDFGALVCRAPRPNCASCPVGLIGACQWRTGGEADPATRSAATARRQASFAGSDRQGRGRILQAALIGAIASSDIAQRAGWPDDPIRALGVARQLADEGLLQERSDGSFVLPST